LALEGSAPPPRGRSHRRTQQGSLRRH
jgi:hypothetical protein